MNALLLAALVAVESSGNPFAVGDGGKAVGALQIHPAVVADVNRIAGTSYTLSDRLSREKSIAMAKVYLAHYCGPNPSPERVARTWNGGPSGHHKPATLNYWRKVKAAMARLSVSTRQHLR
jgi:soluble lytic murein transglycosylase-like protein